MTQPTSAECVFCRIVRGELPCAKVFETDQVLAFLDIGPVRHGHTLVIPKGHYENLMAMPPEPLAELTRCLPSITRGVVGATQATGCALWQLNGRCAGQLVMHVHFHVVPRADGDGLRFNLPSPGTYREGEMAALAAAIAGRIVSSGA